MNYEEYSRLIKDQFDELKRRVDGLYKKFDEVQDRFDERYVSKDMLDEKLKAFEEMRKGFQDMGWKLAFSIILAIVSLGFAIIQSNILK